MKLTLKNLTILFQSPPKNQILVMEEESKRLGIVTKYILKNVDHFVFKMWPIEHLIYMTPQIILKIFKYSKNIFKVQKAGLSLWGSLYYFYLIACMDCIKPKVVISFIDNSFILQVISRTYSDSNFYFIQNATRLKWDLELKHKISFPNFFCFGYFEKEIYELFAHTIDSYFPIGSLLGGYYKSEIAECSSHIEFDICLVSQWRKSIMHDNIVFPELKESIEKMNKYIKRYILKNNLRICIAYCSNEKLEQEYFNKLFENYATMIKFNPNSHSTYDAMNKSSIIVALNSTAAIEAFGWGKKVLIVNLSGSDYYTIPMPDLCYLSEDSYDSFEKKINYLRLMTQETFDEYISSYRPFFMNYDFSDPPHKKIKRLIMSQVEIGEC